jgi:hypothetical protein
MYWLKVVGDAGQELNKSTESGVIVLGIVAMFLVILFGFGANHK